jgi:hypothetical protein
MNEKRRVERLKKDNEVSITIISEVKKSPKEKIIYHISKDISVYGARININSFLPIDTILKRDVTLKYSHQTITVLGKVKWIKSLFGINSYEAGVEFVNTSNDTIRQLANYISRKPMSQELDSV